MRGNYFWGREREPEWIIPIPKFGKGKGKEKNNKEQHIWRKKKTFLQRRRKTEKGKGGNIWSRKIVFQRRRITQ